jgi:hypothetical protein
MKNIFVLIVSVLAVCVSEFAKASPCDSMAIYNPSGSTLLEASRNFGAAIEVLLNGCEVQQLVDAKDSNFAVQSYSRESGKQVLKYKKTIFDAGLKPKEFACVLTQTQTPVEKTVTEGMPLATVAEFVVKNTNECTDANNPKNFVCQKGWIDCMPGGSIEKQKYCSNEYREWAIENCGGAPMIAQ